jgi:hypothetical protein
MNVHYNSLGCVRAKEPCGAFRPGAMIRDMQVSTRPFDKGGFARGASTISRGCIVLSSPRVTLNRVDQLTY